MWILINPINLKRWPQWLGLIITLPKNTTVDKCIFLVGFLSGNCNPLTHLRHGQTISLATADTNFSHQPMCQAMVAQILAAGCPQTHYSTPFLLAFWEVVQNVLEIMIFWCNKVAMFPSSFTWPFLCSVVRTAALLLQRRRGFCRAEGCVSSHQYPSGHRCSGPGLH